MSIVIPNIRTKRKQLSLNMVTTMFSQFLSLGISFFLTPYIVSRLGTSAYGFIGLSNNIIGYTALITVALNSMSARFIVIEYHRGFYIEANRYLSSTVFANCFMATIIVVVLGLLTVFLEQIINIPTELVTDVKFLFTFMFANSAIGLCTGVFGMPFFVKNRLDISNTLGAANNILRVILTIIAFGFFPAHIWYIGAVGLICSIVWICVTYRYYQQMTPEFVINLSFFQVHKVWEMVREGAWNLVTQFSSILNQGVQLLLTNIFIGSYYMGILSIATSLPFVITGVFAALGNNFHPDCIKYYAEGDTNKLRNLLEKGIRLLGALATVPCAGIFVLGDVFYHSWLPEQNTGLLYRITIITMVWLMTTLPTQTLWYIFTLTKTVRKSSIVLLKYGIANCILVILAVLILDDGITKLYAVCIIQALLGIFRFTTFLPIYGAKVLKLPKFAFFKPLMKAFLTTGIITLIGFIFKGLFISSYSWKSLVIGSIFIIIIAAIVNFKMMLTNDDRRYILSLLSKCLCLPKMSR